MIAGRVVRNILKVQSTGFGSRLKGLSEKQRKQGSLQEFWRDKYTKGIVTDR